MRIRLLPILFLALAVVVSVGAVDQIADLFGVGVDTWYGPLKSLAWIYVDLHDKTFGAINTAAQNRFGFEIPPGVSQFVILYLAAALAFVSNTTGLAHRDNMMETARATGLGALLPLAIPVFLWQALRMRVVSRFARENTLSFFAYIILVLATYGVSVWANGAIFKERAEAEEAQTAQVTPATTRQEIAAMGAMDRAAAPGKVDNGLIAGDDTAMSAGATPVSYSPQEARDFGEQLGEALHQQASGGVDDGLDGEIVRALRALPAALPTVVVPATSEPDDN